MSEKQRERTVTESTLAAIEQLAGLVRVEYFDPSLGKTVVGWQHRDEIASEARDDQA